jgi:arylsulfatase A-like enzyme
VQKKQNFGTMFLTSRSGAAVQEGGGAAPFWKKIFWIFLIILLAAVFWAAYRCLDYRSPDAWTLQAPVNAASPKTGGNSFDRILFFNDIYRNYDSFSPRDRLPAKTFSAGPLELAVIRGEKSSRKGALLITGGEIVFAAWNSPGLMAAHRLDLLEMELSCSRSAVLEIAAVPAASGLFGKIKSLVHEAVFRGVPQGAVIGRITLHPGKERGFKRIALPLTHLPGPLAGVLFKIIPGGKRSPRVKIKSLRLCNSQYREYEDMPRLDYFTYGGFERRRIKSVFIPAGGSLTYSILPAHAAETILDGYLASKDGRPLTVEFSVNGEAAAIRKITGEKGVSYFRAGLAARQGRLTLSVAVKGERGAIAVIGNMAISRPGENNKNVVFYLVDALRADKGGVRERLFSDYFQDGAIFSSAYANAVQTADSLPTVFSGRYKFNLVEKDGHRPYLPDDRRLLAEYLKARGYTTAAFINNPWLERTNSSQGFDFIDHCWNHVAEASAFPSDNDYIDLKYGDMEKNLRAFVRENKHKPVFIYLHAMEPHIPYEPPVNRRKYSAGADVEVLETIFKTFTQAPPSRRMPGPDPGRVRVLKSLYKDQVLLAYDFFARVCGFLEGQSIINKSSLFIFTSDHGERFYEHRSWAHGPPDVYNEVARIPLMIKGANLGPGVYNRNVQLVDIYPTIVDWLGGEPVESLAGNSLTRYINKKDRRFEERKIYIDGTGDFPHYALIDGGIKVIVKGTGVEVYDLSRDPGETRDLASDPAYKKLIAEARAFRGKFQARRSRTGKKKQRLSRQEIQRLKTLGYID